METSPSGKLARPNVVDEEKGRASSGKIDHVMPVSRSRDGCFVDGIISLCLSIVTSFNSLKGKGRIRERQLRQQFVATETGRRANKLSRNFETTVGSIEHRASTLLPLPRGLQHVGGNEFESGKKKTSGPVDYTLY